MNSVFLAGTMFLALVARGGARQMENLGRGVVAIHQGGGKVYIGWPRRPGHPPLGRNPCAQTDSRPIEVRSPPEYR